MKKKLLILCSLLAFLACSDDKSNDGPSAGPSFWEALHSENIEENSDEPNREERDEDSDQEEQNEVSGSEEWNEDFGPDEDFFDDSDEWHEPSSSSKKKNAVRSSSSADKSPESSEYSEVNIEPVSSSSNSSASATLSSSSYKNCCADVSPISAPALFTDLWYGDLYAVNTDAYAGEKWKNRDVGLWFTNTDSIDGGESRIIWPELPGTAYYEASLDPIIDYCYGLCGEFQLDGSAHSIYPFVEIGFFLVGLDSNGKDIAVDVSNWEGICIQYTASVSPAILLDLGDSVNKTVEYDVPRVQLPKSISGADRCYLWSDFEQEGWGQGDHITGEQAATHLARVIFRMQEKDGSKGYFNITSLGTAKAYKL